MPRRTRQAEMERVVCRLIDQPPNALYDIGVGSKSEWKTLGKAYPKMKVYGCEPLADLHPGLEQAFPGQLHRVGIGTAERTNIRFKPGERLMDASTVSFEGDDYEEREIILWTLDQFDRVCHQPDRILLWMDIEGAEFDALRSGVNLLVSGRVKWINLEEKRPGTERQVGWPSAAQLETLLSKFGYVRKLEYNVHPGHQDAIYVHEEEL